MPDGIDATPNCREKTVSSRPEGEYFWTLDVFVT
jgi:hypothetical protein